MKKAFSLVELSIVLVILGLLVGGILAGRSLIRAAELRSVSVDYQRYQAASNSFRDKYFALAGDMTNATQFWGRLVSAGTCDTNSSAAVNTATGACDNTGDGKLMGQAIGGGTSISESGMHWRELSLAGLIEGNYTGYDNVSAGYSGVPWANSYPGSRVSSKALWLARTYTSQTANVTDNYYMVGAVRDPSTSDNFLYGGIMKPEEAWNIDSKLDDGNPINGRIHSARTSEPDTGATCSAGSSYSITGTSAACALEFKM